MALVLQRALVAEPLVVFTAASQPAPRRRGTRAAVTLTLVGGAGFAGGMALIGLAVGGFVAEALLLFAPWVAPALVQDLWRSSLFRDGRGGAATCNDGTWILIMVALAPAAWAIHTNWAIVGCWGIGALGGAALGFWQFRLVPARLRLAIGWWRADASKLARWLGAEGVIYNVAAQTGNLIIATVLGPSSLGGLRAVQTVFAPLTLFTPAIGMPGLPMVTRNLAISFARGRKLALEFSALLIALTVAYLGVLALGGEQLLADIFGKSFQSYDDLILPVGVSQLVTAAGEGLFILMKASNRGKQLFLARAILAPLGLAAIFVAAVSSGLLAVAWTMAAMRIVLVTAIGTVALRPPKVVLWDPRTSSRG